MTAENSRGIRNNNPGNIRRSNDPWQGLAQQQTDKDFLVFQNPVYGIRALARTLIAYQDKHGLRSIRQIISRWAPATENNTEAYVQAVAKNTGFNPDQKLDMHSFADLKPVVVAIIQHENGQQPYTDAQLTKALVLAGVEPEKPSLQASRTVKGGQAATAATVGVGVVEAVKEAIDPAQAALLTLAPYLEVAKWLLLIVTLIGIGVMIWARIDDRQKGIN
jgi:hypothetical protein